MIHISKHPPSPLYDVFFEINRAFFFFHFGVGRDRDFHGHRGRDVNKRVTCAHSPRTMSRSHRIRWQLIDGWHCWSSQQLPKSPRRPYQRCAGRDAAITITNVEQYASAIARQQPAAVSSLPLAGRLSRTTIVDNVQHVSTYMKL